MLKLAFKPYDLQLNHVFRIARAARTSTPLVLTQLSYEGVNGYGEAAMPPLYGESIQTASTFLSRLDLKQFKNPFAIEEILSYVDKQADGNTAAKAAVDIALHDLVGKLLNIPLYHYFGLPAVEHATCMTISIDQPEKMALKAQEYPQYPYLKIKLGTDYDQEMIQAIRGVTKQLFFIDANQGWTNREAALDFIYWLKEQGTVFIEQPLPKENKEDQAWLTARSPLPIIGDEGVQRLDDVKEAANLYHGINIKLMKSTGLREAYKMAITAKALGTRVMLGCMSETSCAITAAAHLGALAEWVDLDGNLYVANDPYRGAKVENGILHLTEKPGIGLTESNWEGIAV